MIKNKIKCAVFGFKDSMVGQILHMLKENSNYEIEFLITVNELAEINIENEHSIRPNRKTEFIVNNRIYNKKLYYEKDYISLLKSKNITNCFVLEDDRLLRQEIFNTLRNNEIKVLSFIHPSTYLGGVNSIGDGVIIFQNCYIGYKADVGDGSIIQSNCTIEHHNVVGDFVDINPNLTTGGFTKISDYCEINMSVDICDRVTVGLSSQIGAGSLVLKSIEANSLHYGRPSKFIRKI